MTLVSEGRSYFDEAASANNFRPRPRKHTRPISPPKQLDFSFRSISNTHNMATSLFFYPKSLKTNYLRWIILHISVDTLIVGALISIVHVDQASVHRCEASEGKLWILLIIWRGWIPIMAAAY